MQPVGEAKTERSTDSLPAALGYADFVPVQGRVPFPDICCDLVWVRDELYITGPESRPKATAFPGERVRLLRLAPAVARAWLGVPLGLISNRQVALRDIDRRLDAPIRALAEVDALIELQAATNRGPQPERTRLTAALAVLSRTRSVRSAATAIDLSERQLERLFAVELGVLPRECIRIMRFRAAGVAARRGACLADAAATAGFSDQAHFTRESVSFTGQTPRVLIRAHVGIVQDAEIGRF